MAPLTGHYCLKSLLSHSYYDFNIVYYHCILANLQLIKLIFLWWNFNCYFIQFSLSFPSHLFITPTSIAVAIHSLRIILFCVCVAIPIDGYFTTLELRALSKFPQRGNNYYRGSLDQENVESVPISVTPEPLPAQIVAQVLLKINVTRTNYICTTAFLPLLCNYGDQVVLLGIG